MFFQPQRGRATRMKNRRRARPGAPRRPVRTHLELEPLEDRRLLSITWVNRGGVADTDNFTATYGATANLARALVDRIRPLGWHMELLIHVDGVPDLDARLKDFPVDLVFGHLGYVRPGQSPDIPGFQALLRLMAGGRAWVKLTGPYRISRDTVPYGDTDAFARALFEAAPDHLVWGSDWPHSNIFTPGHIANDGDMLDLLAEYAPDEAVRNRILVDNPARLYGFED